MQPDAPQRRAYGGEDLLGVLAAAIDSTLQTHGISARASMNCALEATDKMRLALGGTTVYVPKGRPDAGEAAAEVYALVQGGRTAAEVADQFGYSSSYVYKLLAQERTRLKSLLKARRR
ncbi:UNVERIFIED_ORG: hypothetical protein LHJ69_00450 [Shinella sp. XGS7]|nr:Mor transcription activator family protein [Shinella sp. XGS7]